tara:strand:- start:2839 stop:4146 length:1308 start_codon:yes stop_codon:yes gene_type:complete
MSHTTLSVRVAPMDTWFFREARPHDAVGASRLSSQFPPPAGTLIGALRTRLGDHLGIDWKQHTEQQRCEQTLQGINLSDLLGTAADTGLLTFGPLQLLQQDEKGNDQLLYPTPALLLEQADSKTTAKKLLRLKPGSAMVCDLSQADEQSQLATVIMPELPANSAGAKPLENSWITTQGMVALMKGGLPDAGNIIRQSDLFESEARLGIARDNQKSTVLEGKLYQTEHLRLQPNVELGIDITLPDAAAEALQVSIQQQPIQRFGGEGRMAYLSTVVADSTSTELTQSLLAAITKRPNNSSPHGLILMLQADAQLDSTLLPGFTMAFEPCPETGRSRQVWRGVLNGIALTLITAVTGKAARKGGWDLQHKKPKGMRSFVPAGSCWFVEVDAATSLEDAIIALNGYVIGGEATDSLTEQHTDTINGRGTLLCGLWTKR